MAEMKHAKKPEKKLPGQSAPKPEKPRPSIGRDRVFRAQLAREYGVEKLPESLKLRTEKTLSTLPDVMPAKPRPVLRAFRGMATAAAALAVTSAVLIGLNATSPQLTESLPGLGPVFAALNEKASPSPLPTPTPEPTPEPEFEQVTLENRGDFPGELTLEEAWSDGRGLYMELSIAPKGEDFYYICKESGLDGEENTYLWPAAMMVNDLGETYPEYNCSVTIYGENDSHSIQGYGFSAFTPAGDGTFKARWYLDLEELEVGRELKVSVSLPDLSAQSMGYDEVSDDEAVYTWHPDFEGTFTLPIAEGGNRSFTLHASDGPVTLRSISYTPSKVELDVSLPYLGPIKDLMPDNGALSDWPLGFYARLSCQGPEGKEFIYGVAERSPENRSMTAPELAAETDLHYTFTALNEQVDPRELRGPLVLTLYEFPPNYVEGPSFGRVNAEFTIDLNTGRASPSENYLKEGYEKGDASKTTLERIEEASTDGLILMPWENYYEAINSGNDPLSCFVISAPAENAGRELTVSCYLEDTVYRSFTFALGQNIEEGGDSCYASYHYAGGREFLDASVTVAYPEWVAEDMGYVHFDRIELSDAATGEIIIPDLQTALLESSEKLLNQNFGETDGSLNNITTESHPEL